MAAVEVTSTMGERPHQLLPGDDEPVTCWCVGEFFECTEGHQHFSHNQPYISLDSQPRMTVYSH